MFDQILTQEYDSQSNDFTADGFFNFFSAQLILKEHELSYEEVLDGIVDGPLDGGIDALYLTINNELIREDFKDYQRYKRDVNIEVVVLQSKNTEGFGESAIQKLRSSLITLLRLDASYDDLKKKYNAQVLDFFRKFTEAYRSLIAKSPSLSIKIYYSTKAAVVHENVTHEKDELLSELQNLHRTAAISFDFLGSEQLLELHRKRPREHHILRLAENPMSSTGKTLVTLVNLKDFYKFITKENGLLNKSIFESNVRDYQGDTNVNSGISETLMSDKTLDFWWLNNGITILAADINYSGSKELVIISPEIVNGLQTSNEIYNYFSKPDIINTEEKRNALIKVVVADATSARDKIIKATNSQNHIAKAVLRATDPIHRDIEEYLKKFGIFYDRRKNFYKNAGKKPSEIIGLPLLAQILMSILMGRPDTARARPSTLLEEENDDSAYKLLFNPESNIEIYKISIEIMRKADEFLKGIELTPNERNNLRFYLIYDVAIRALKTAKITPEKLSRIKLDLIATPLLEESFNFIFDKYKTLGGDDKVAKGAILLSEIKKMQEKLFIQPDLF
ncbi:hypothetical protein EAY64_09190 [Aquitalea palustris]|uniref:Abortive phage infection protein C-terminal domain-containing protein n=1 Tax=Aquitalea palustris TaxID=2480983 RepID=A0A454JJ03_9NEIS|nr:hypothetical protein EAY64_09190 [Aquitalea palustris]